MGREADMHHKAALRCLTAAAHILADPFMGVPGDALALAAAAVMHLSHVGNAPEYALRKIDEIKDDRQKGGE